MHDLLYWNFKHTTIISVIKIFSLLLILLVNVCGITSAEFSYYVFITCHTQYCCVSKGESTILFLLSVLDIYRSVFSHKGPSAYSVLKGKLNIHLWYSQEGKNISLTFLFPTKGKEIKFFFSFLIFIIICYYFLNAANMYLYVF